MYTLTTVFGLKNKYTVRDGGMRSLNASAADLAPQVRSGANVFWNGRGRQGTQKKKTIFTAPVCLILINTNY